MGKTKIEWCARPGTIPMNWSPVTGCTPISAGCKFCWAKRMARRLAGRHSYPEYPNHFDVTLHPDRLEQPLKWKKPRTIFVCGMSDFCHPDVSWEYRNRILQTISHCPGHLFLILTKRAKEARDYFTEIYRFRKPLPNIWLGVTAENQEQWDYRLHYLRQTPAAVRYVSVEPMLSTIDCRDDLRYRYPGSEGFSTDNWPPIDWVICGGESGPNARPMHPDWARGIRDQCQAAGVPFFFKQWGAWSPRILFPDITTCPNKWGTLDDEGNWFPLTTPWNGRQGEESPEREYVMAHVGKKRAGCLLDGKKWSEFPPTG